MNSIINEVPFQKLIMHKINIPSAKRDSARGFSKVNEIYCFDDAKKMGRSGKSNP